MESSSLRFLNALPAVDYGCAYIFDAGRQLARKRCSAPRQAGSSYCPYHHARCHLLAGSPAETARLSEIERLAETVGGRCAAKAVVPSRRFLDRLESLSRDLS